MAFGFFGRLALPGSIYRQSVVSGPAMNASLPRGRPVDVFVLIFIKKDIGAVITPLGNVMRIIGRYDASESWHECGFSLILTNRQAL